MPIKNDANFDESRIWKRWQPEIIYADTNTPGLCARPADNAMGWLVRNMQASVIRKDDKCCVCLCDRCCVLCSSRVKSTLALIRKDGDDHKQISGIFHFFMFPYRVCCAFLWPVNGLGIGFNYSIAQTYRFVCRRRHRHREILHVRLLRVRTSNRIHQLCHRWW